MSDYTLDTATIDTHPELRARIVPDMDADEPYDDGGSPILRLDYGRYGWTAEQTTTTSHTVSESILEAAGRWAGQLDMLERYLRMFHGTSTVKSYDRNGSSFVTFDTAEWREKMGLTDEYMAAWPDVDFDLANMDEYLAYLDGDRYGVIVEKCQTWHLDGDDGVTREDWVEIDSCWGFYGIEYATQRAAEMIVEAV